MTHPIRRPDVVAEVETWTAVVVKATGTATVTVELDYKDGQFRGFRVGGYRSKVRQEPAVEGLTQRTG